MTEIFKVGIIKRQKDFFKTVEPTLWNGNSVSFISRDLCNRLVLFHEGAGENVCVVVEESQSSSYVGCLLEVYIIFIPYDVIWVKTIQTFQKLSLLSIRG